MDLSQKYVLAYTYAFLKRGKDRREAFKDLQKECKNFDKKLKTKSVPTIILTDILQDGMGKKVLFVSNIRLLHIKPYIENNYLKFKYNY